MGRELKRVPIDFQWPIGQIWKGYVNPYRSTPCGFCEQSGLNPPTKKLNDDWYAFDSPNYIGLPNGRRYNGNAWQYHLTQREVDALVEKGRLWDFTHQFKSGEGLVKKNPEYIPTAEQVNEWAKSGMGHDSINRWICVEARAKHLGIYGECEHCKGEGELWSNPEVQALNEAWTDEEPPTGEGYQLWSTTTEGHPMSPVFKTLEALCEYLEKEKVSVFGSNTATEEQWVKMLNDGLVAHREGNAVFL